MKQETKRRALYFFTCDACDHKRTSRLYWRAKELICLKCRKNTVPENQQSLFTEIGFIKTEATKENLKNIDLLEISVVKNRRVKKVLLSPREAAKKLISADVGYGRTCNEIANSYAGTASGEYKAEIITGGKIRVYSIARKELNPPEVFTIKEIYNELKLCSLKS